VAKKEIVVNGRTKRLLASDDQHLILEFGDEAITPGGRTKKLFKGKGELCSRFSETIFSYLDSYNIPNHYVERAALSGLKVRRLQVLPLSVMVRNVATADLVERFEVEEGANLDYPVIEHYFKRSGGQLILVNDSHCQAFSLASLEEMRAIRRMASKVNAILRSFFDRRGVILIDFRLEFGKAGANLMIADEFSPDTCRLWDRRTRKKYDFDCLKSGLAGAEATYKEILERILN